MRKNVISLSVVSGGVLSAYIGLFTTANVYFLNYREMRINGWFYLGINIGLSLYLLGICATAVIFQRMSSQGSEIEPSFLMLGGTIGLLVGSSPLLFNLLTQASYYSISPLIILPVSFLLSILGIRIACEFPHRESNFHRRVLLSRNLIGWLVALLALTVIWMNNSSFPGITAASVVRQQWADKEFNRYKEVVDTIKTCQPIIKQVGRVKYVAPTSGRNYVISDPGSSGHSGEFTLEVVGQKGVGVANFSFHIDTVVSHGKLTYQGRTQEIVCRS
ncbi:hypothetical protein NIES2098_16390 [Calothrix sp. NIES-2098]|nr:hypothetical protein NIES2098_16390 [Calothrix sp. NIES-2098]